MSTASDDSPSERTESDSSDEGDVRHLPGIERLREQRGAEQVRFNDIADHLVDFVREHPHARNDVEHLAAFLAGIEHEPHRHLGSGSTVKDAPEG